MIEILTSTSNPKIKALLALQQKSSQRRKESLFVVEGAREIERCISSGFELDTVFVCPEIAGDVSLPQNCRCFYVSKELYSKIAYREGTEGIIAEVKSKALKLEDLNLPENALIMVLESVEKPGNLGAILRSCDAAGADALLVCDPLTDLFNPNLIRASLGAAFSVPTVACSSEDAIEFLQKRSVQILTAQLQDSELYYDIDMKRATALVMGTESTGLSDAWRRAATAHIRIPMLGMVDSLNVSVSAAILLYESVRQRNG